MSEPLDIDAIKARHQADHGREVWAPHDEMKLLKQAHRDRAALIAEVERLRVMETFYIEQMQSDQASKDQLAAERQAQP